MPHGPDLLLNTERYTVIQLTVFGIGCLLWVVSYVAVLVHVRKEQFVTIPAAAVVANISWEWLWGFFFKPDLGLLVLWGYRIWAILDVFIVVSLLRYGAKQLLTPTGKQYFPYAVAFGLIAWFTSLYFFIREGYDMSMGATSAYIINVMMSAVYIVMVVKHPETRKFSFTVAWTKGLGTALISVFMFLAPLRRYPYIFNPAVADDRISSTPRGFLLTLCVLSLVLDVVFVASFWMKLRATDHPALQPRAVTV